MIGRKQPSAYAPSTLAADVNRLLDPYYAYDTRSSFSSSSSSSPASATFVYGGQPKAYVDAAGDLHDPDYRDFPGMPSPVRTPKRHIATTTATTTAPARRGSMSPTRGAAFRPAWERGFEPEEGSASDDEDAVSRFYQPYGLRRVASSTATTPSLARSRSDSGSSWSHTSPVRPEPFNFTHRPSFEEEVEYEEREDDDEELALPSDEESKEATEQQKWT